MRTWLSFIPEPFLTVVLALIVGGVVLNFVAVSALFFIWLERKVAGRMQDRLGPTRVGGKYGWLQTIADGIKLLLKEDFMPTAADGILFRIAPYIAFSASFVSFIALPFGADLVGQELQVAVYFILAVLASEVFGVILAGYASASKWSLFGGIREAAQVVSYEVPRGICVLIPVLISGTLNLNTIGKQQEGYVFDWLIFHDPFTFCAFWIFFICATAGCKRAPFDLAEAESELVAGFHTEYSGLRWSFFFMAEYASMFAVSGIATLLFLGGWHTGFLPFEPSVQFGLAGHLLNLIVFVLKGWCLVFLMMWMRWSLPRLRIDQVMMTCLKYFLPISCGLFLGVCLWQLLAPAALSQSWKFFALAVVLASAGVIIYKLLTAPKIAARGRLMGAWESLPTPLTKNL
ncbi:NADH-quinone oxidoreductase subunit NuoH [Telmatocola sphagniphila]|uniref:NADH-quinone oxidoreductase subunit H n=1 Tax=Telmatocola sphagniphila TaxID=1123043 RepID=A0A8E6BAM7_9BACT|nr:NADH-quinone oxidoreductase subunit NuoH [Telmatocola sphagniphila]